MEVIERLGEHMGLWTKQQLREFIKENNLVSAQDAQNALKDLFAETIQEMLEAEMDTHLGYGKHEVKAKLTPNSRNGKSRKTVVSEYGEQEIAIPRDRLGEFEPLVVKKHQSNVTGIEEQIIALYAKGISTREIQDHLGQMSVLKSPLHSFPMSQIRLFPSSKNGRIGHCKAFMLLSIWMRSISRSSRMGPLSTRLPTWSLVSIWMETRMS